MSEQLSKREQLEARREGLEQQLVQLESDIELTRKAILDTDQEIQAEKEKGDSEPWTEFLN